MRSAFGIRAHLGVAAVTVVTGVGLLLCAACAPVAAGYEADYVAPTATISPLPTPTPEIVASAPVTTIDIVTHEGYHFTPAGLVSTITWREQDPGCGCVRDSRNEDQAPEGLALFVITEAWDREYILNNLNQGVEDVLRDLDYSRNGVLILYEQQGGWYPTTIDGVVRDDEGLRVLATAWRTNGMVPAALVLNQHIVAFDRAALGLTAEELAALSVRLDVRERLVE